MKDFKRNSFIFYRSFSETCEEFIDFDIENEDERQAEADRLELEWFRGINNFALNGEEPIFKDRILRIAWKNVYPVIHKTNQLYKNGLLGGRPKKEITEGQDETKAKPRQNQGETKAKPKQNQNESKTKPDISSSSNNNTNKEQERELEQEPNQEPNQERKDTLPLSIESFKKSFPTKIVDIKKVPKDVDMEKLILAIKQSKFLSDPNVTNLKLSWFFENYKDVVAGRWAKYTPANDKKQTKAFKGRENNASELNALFDNIEEIEV